MAMAMFARALSLRRANQRARETRRAAGDMATEYGIETLPEQSAIHSSRVSQSIDALYVLSCLRNGLSPADTFVSDDESSACYRLFDEKLAPSSLSLSEHARSSDAWDRFSSSLSSSGSDSVESSGKDGVRCCNNSSLMNREKLEDFCLVFNTEQPLSSPSPRAAATSDCCSFLISRKSNHSEDNLRGLSKRDQRESAADSTVCVQRTDKSRQNNGMQGAGAAVSAGTSVYSRVKLIQDGAGEGDDLQSFLREGTMKTVEKQSCNPYQDFRESMLQMMISTCCSSHGKADAAESGHGAADHHELISKRSADSYAGDDQMNIEDLLYCYLRLNSMDLHELITQAFSDTCSDLLLMNNYC